MPSILILGEAGQLARALHELPWPADHRVSALGRSHLGSAGQAAQAAAAAIRGLRPHLVLNAAAYTAVDRAEAEPAAAAALNADLPLAIARTCSDLDIPLVHVSTDYVFDGAKSGAYLETDAPNPLSVYGATKLSGDRHIDGAAKAPWAILRSSWVFSAAPNSFPSKLLARAATGEELPVVNDQRGCPTPTRALAAAMREVGGRLLDRDNEAQGLFNFCGARAMSWHAFAEILLESAAAAGLRRPDLRAITSDQLSVAARRPRNSALDCGWIKRKCNIEPPDIGEHIDGLVRTILAR